MTDRRVARRYAKALFDLAAERGEVDAWGSALKSVNDTLAADGALREALLGCALPLEGKHTLVKNIFSDSVPELVMNFLLLVLDKNRQEDLPLMQDCYREMADAASGLVRVEAVSPAALDQAGVEKLRVQLAASLKAPVEVNVSVDESLIGGIVLKIGDKLYDGSVKHGLALLQKVMEG